MMHALISGNSNMFLAVLCLDWKIFGALSRAVKSVSNHSFKVSWPGFALMFYGVYSITCETILLLRFLLELYVFLILDH